MKEMKILLCQLFLLVAGVQFAQAQDQSDNKYKNETNIKMNKEMKFCQSCGMPLTEDVLGTNADGSKNEDYCMYCYRDGKFLQDCTMEEMIEHCAQFIGAVNEGLEKPITKEEYIGLMKTYFPQLKRWRQTLDVSNDEATNVNPALAGVKELIAQMADKQPIAYISSVDLDGFPWTKAMLKPRKREGIKTFYFTTNTFSIRVAQYKANPKASIYFCEAKGFKTTPRLSKAIDEWQEQKRLEAVQMLDTIKDIYRRRAAVIGFRCGVIFMLLVGKESNACIEFALTMAEYTLQNQCRLFGPLLKLQNERVRDRMPTATVNQNVLQQLPSPFSIDDLRRLKGNECADGTLYSILSRWKAEGWIEKVDKNNWTKTQTLQSCNLA